MRRSKIPGSIVYIGSIASHGGAPFISAYSVSKGALNTLTKVAAVELQPDRIRCNCLTIGWTVTANEDAQRTESDGEDGVCVAATTAQAHTKPSKPSIGADAGAGVGVLRTPHTHTRARARAHERAVTVEN